MKRNATAKRGPRRNAEGNVSIRENAPRIKEMGKPFKTPTGTGLGKAGAKRLGRLLKRAIQQQEEPLGKTSLPKTPVRLLKHQIQSTNNAPKMNATKRASPRVSKLILSMVSQCKRRDGISMGELKQTLAAEGFNVTKNNKQVKVVTKRVVNNETLVRTTRNASIRINKKTLTDIRQVKINSVTPAKPKGELKQSTTAHKSPKGAERPQRRTKETPKSGSKSHTAKGKTQTAAKSHKKPAKPCKPAAKSHNQRTQTTRARRKQQKAGGKKRRTAKNQATQSRKPQREAERRRQAKRNQHSYKSTKKRRLPR